MAISLSFKVDGKMKTFKKDDIYLTDNIRAVKHSIVQSEYYTAEKPSAEKYEEMQADFCEMIADLFNNEFSGDQLRQAYPLSKFEDLEEIYVQALGGKSEEDSEKK